MRRTMGPATKKKRKKTKAKVAPKKLTKSDTQGWEQITLFYVHYKYSWSSYDTFYYGRKEGGRSTGTSRLFDTKERAVAQMKEWEKGEGPPVGVVAEFSYGVRSLKVWMRKKGRAKEYALRKPLECSCPCQHCPAATFKGLTFLQLMIKKNVPWIELTGREQTAVNNAARRGERWAVDERY